jgi:hypothetical protein
MSAVQSEVLRHDVAVADEVLLFEGDRPGRLAMLEELGADRVVPDGLDGAQAGEAVAPSTPPCRPRLLLADRDGCPGRPPTDAARPGQVAAHSAVGGQEPTS